jgi:hypothetical protein
VNWSTRAAGRRREDGAVKPRMKSSVVSWRRLRAKRLGEAEDISERERGDDEDILLNLTDGGVRLKISAS